MKKIESIANKVKLNVSLNWRLWRLEVFFKLAWRYPTLGVNSHFKDGQHILMWDFDDIPYEVIHAHLRLQQRRWQLSNIYVMRSSQGDRFHAYCFTGVTWQIARQIAASTPYVDKNWLAIGILRGYFTLRIRDRKDSAIQPYQVIESDRPETVHPGEMSDLSEYFMARP